MSGLEYAREEVVKAFPNRADVVPASNGVEVVVYGGVKASELVYLETVFGAEGFQLERIYFHRNRDALVFRFSPMGVASNV
ncbi:hypothetical protein TK0586 [Thermococcus kodakarensis KOD1]|uniref:Uncharacterized protein n=2 Tax=Thermococcus TaxID=2263 RepID=Q5JFC8_THEKO|nr:hypothetical protein TK0586 [Thermococcus kodakarensis KOD1]